MGVVDSDCVLNLPECDHVFKFTNVEEEEVLQLLLDLDISKAIGADAISSKLLRFAAPGISGSLAVLFNYSLRCGKVPLEWKSALVYPVLKGGNSEDVGNYRPVSVLPIIVKIFERLLHRQLYRYLQMHSILYSTQSGFRPQHTTQDVVVAMVDEWRKALDEDKLVGAVMLDLSKAFDLVNHSILLKKMERYGIRGVELSWFMDYLTGRSQRVCVGQDRSDWIDVHKGVPQGSVLGPLLFILYVNDLPRVLEACTIKQYADDTTVSHTAVSASDLELSLNRDMESITKWMDKNRLKLNAKKTQLLLLGRRFRAHELESVKVIMNGEQLIRSRMVKYLGVWIDDGLTWRRHIEMVRKKCFSGLSNLRRFSGVLPSALKKKVYNALVLPHLDYCSVVWQECVKELQLKVERIQNYGIRLILSKPPLTPSADLRKALGWLPLTDRRRLSRLALVHRCINSKGPEYMSEIFKTNEDVGCRVTRGYKKMHIFPVKTEWYKRSFAFKGSQEWNLLPRELRETRSTLVFKNLLRKWIVDLS